MIIKADSLPEIYEPDNSLVMKRVVHREAHSAAISVTWVRLWGQHQELVCDVSDRVYYIIDGQAEFQVGGEPLGQVRAGDYVFIPRGVPYVFSGDMTYLVMNGPAFVPGSDRVLD
ncbi:MAG: cupin domain-containing protein [Anaerolineae bacterium]